MHCTARECYCLPWRLRCRRLHERDAPARVLIRSDCAKDSQEWKHELRTLYAYRWQQVSAKILPCGSHGRKQETRITCDSLVTLNAELPDTGALEEAVNRERCIREEGGGGK